MWGEERRKGEGRGGEKWGEGREVGEGEEEGGGEEEEGGGGGEEEEGGRRGGQGEREKGGEKEEARLKCTYLLLASFPELPNEIIEPGTEIICLMYRQYITIHVTFTKFRHDASMRFSL